MKAFSFFSRSELTRTLRLFKYEFLIVGLFSMVANLLMLAPTLYMLQVYDRVLVSRSELTLIFVSLITLFLFGVMAFSEWARSRLLVRIGVRLDAALGTRVFNASFEANLSRSGAAAQRSFQDLIELRQFVTGNGTLAFFDVPWMPVYLAVLFFLHPFLGWVAMAFTLVQVALAWFGHRNTVAPADAASKAGQAANLFLQTKLRNTEVVESMGMLGGLQKRWAERHAHYMEAAGRFAGLVPPHLCHQQVGTLLPAVVCIGGRRLAGD